MDKTRLPISHYHYTRFTWRCGAGSVDASDLGIPVGAVPGGRVWADACDEGFVVDGEREEKLFTLSAEFDGSWVFTSVDGLHTVTIYND